MKLEKSKHGNYGLFLWDVGNPEPRGIEKSCVVLTKEQMTDLGKLVRDNGF